MSFVPSPHDIHSDESGESNSQVAVFSALGLCFNGVNHELVEFVDFGFVHNLESLDSTASHSRYVPFLKLSNIIDEAFDGLATREKATNRFVDGRVGYRNAKNRIASSHHA